MKKFTIIIFLVLATLKVNAQDYLISFAGTGDTSAVGTIKVDNLKSGATVTLNGGDILNLKAVLGIGDLGIDNRKVQLYPNPIAEQSILTFLAPENGTVDIAVVDFSGKTVHQTSIFLSTGTCSFRISGISPGIYFVKVNGKNYHYSTKLASQSNPQGEAKIEYVSSGWINSGNPLKTTAATIEMKYTQGDMLMYRGIAGQYSTIVTDVPASSKTITFTFAGCTDSDGNHYATVRIGTLKSGVQTWMAENLNVGIRIQDIFQTNNNVIEKNCYENIDANCNTYGGLYTWGEALQYTGLEGAQGICPGGWHIPIAAEWSELTTFSSLGPEEFAGGKMKEAGINHWKSPNTGATNESGFTGLPAGVNSPYTSPYSLMGESAKFWSSTAIPPIAAWSWGLYFSNSRLGNDGSWEQGWAFSVRCIRNN